MTTPIRRQHEPLRATVIRNLLIALVASTVVSTSSSHSRYPIRWQRALEGSAFSRRPTWWLAGLAFIGIELIVHAALQARGRPNFYNGPG